MSAPPGGGSASQGGVEGPPHADDEEAPVPLTNHALIVLDIWRRRLREWATALRVVLREVSDDERRGAAEVWDRVNLSARMVALQVRDLRAEVREGDPRAEHFWALGARVVRQLPPQALVEALVEASDNRRSVMARFPVFLVLIPACNAGGLFGEDANNIPALMQAYEGRVYARVLLATRGDR